RDQVQAGAIHQPETSDRILAANGQKSISQESSEGPKVPTGDMPGTPDLNEQLKQRFPDVQQRIAFFDRALEIVQSALARAWALRRLRDRYTSEHVAQLDRGSRQTLELLIRDNVSALGRYADEARALILPLLPSEPTRIASL